MPPAPIATSCASRRSAWSATTTRRATAASPCRSRPGRWRGFGYRVERQEYQAQGVRRANLAVERAGREPAGGILLIGAHYDSVRRCPAANDNGSGVAALLELARRFAEIEPACTLRFVAFANEEPPFFMMRQQAASSTRTPRGSVATTSASWRRSRPWAIQRRHRQVEQGLGELVR
jgi:hypothetical protein